MPPCCVGSRLQAVTEYLRNTVQSLLQIIKTTAPICNVFIITPIIVLRKVNVKNHYSLNIKNNLLSSYMKIISISLPVRSRPAQSTVTRWLGWKNQESFISWQEQEIFPSSPKQRNWITDQPVCNTGLFACGYSNQSMKQTTHPIHCRG